MRSVTLARFGHTLLLELRMLLSHWGMWIAFVLWILGVYQVSSGGDSTTTTVAVLLQSTYLVLVPFILTLLVMVLSGMSAARAGRIRFAALEKTYPAGLEIWLARWLAIMIVTLIFLLPTVIIALLFPHVLDLPQIIAAYVIQIMVTTLFLTGLVFVIHLTIGIKRWTFVALIMGWVAAGLISNISTDTLPVSSLVSFNTVGMLGRYYSDLWGNIFAGELPLWYLVVYSGLLVMMIGLVGMIVSQQRMRRLSMVALTVTIFGIAVSGYGVLNYVTIVNNAYSQVVSQPDEQMMLSDALPYQVTSYDIIADFTAEPTFTVTMEVRNRSEDALDTLTFSLNQYLKIVDATPAAIRDENSDTITVTLSEALAPDNTTTVEMTYTGRILHYEPAWSPITPMLDGFIADNGINLPCYTGWYPIPGQQLVTDTTLFTMAGRADCLLDDSVAVSLEIVGGGNLMFASNLTQQDDALFTAQHTRWIHLMGARDLQTEIFGDVTLILPSFQMPFARAFVSPLLAPALTQLQELYPGVVEGVQVMAVDGQLSFTATGMTDGKVIVNVGRYTIDEVDDLFAQHMIWTGLTRSLHDGSGSFTADQVGLFMWIYDLADGDVEAMARYFDPDAPESIVNTMHFFSEENMPITYALYDLYREEGLEGLQSMLAEIRAITDDLNTIQPQEMADRIRS